MKSPAKLVTERPKASVGEMTFALRDTSISVTTKDKTASYDRRTPLGRKLLRTLKLAQQRRVALARAQGFAPAPAAEGNETPPRGEVPASVPDETAHPSASPIEKQGASPAAVEAPPPTKGPGFMARMLQRVGKVFSPGAKRSTTAQSAPPPLDPATKELLSPPAPAEQFTAPIVPPPQPGAVADVSAVHLYQDMIAITFADGAVLLEPRDSELAKEFGESMWAMERAGMPVADLAGHLCPRPYDFTVEVADRPTLPSQEPQRQDAAPAQSLATTEPEGPMVLGEVEETELLSQIPADTSFEIAEPVGAVGELGSQSAPPAQSSEGVRTEVAPPAAAQNPQATQTSNEEVVSVPLSQILKDHAQDGVRFSEPNDSSLLEKLAANASQNGREIHLRCKRTGDEVEVLGFSEPKVDGNPFVQWGHFREMCARELALLKPAESLDLPPALGPAPAAPSGPLKGAQLIRTGTNFRAGGQQQAPGFG